ncbi:hypothetical protein ACPCG0_04290 [Propionibacteriaceae bacterium Y1923]|uniref:hypothetical protein n=1 Tax=Aestuariimicrobium sp. Y1814 TaxID=3418742 RepID=UPI003C28AB30
MSDNSELLAAIEALTAKVDALEAQVQKLAKSQRIPEEDLVAISAAVAAYMGHSVKVKAVRFRQSSAWTSESRSKVHNRQVLHVR